MVGLFALLGLPLWAVTEVLQAPAADPGGERQPDPLGPGDPDPGVIILDRYGNPLVNNLPTEQITLSRVAAQQHPAVIGRLAA